MSTGQDFYKSESFTICGLLTSDFVIENHVQGRTSARPWTGGPVFLDRLHSRCSPCDWSCILLELNLRRLHPLLAILLGHGPNYGHVFRLSTAADGFVVWLVHPLVVEQVRDSFLLVTLLFFDL